MTKYDLSSYFDDEERALIQKNLKSTSIQNNDEYEEILKKAAEECTTGCSAYVLNSKGIHNRCKKKAYFLLRKKALCLKCAQPHKGSEYLMAINPLFQSFI